MPMQRAEVYESRLATSLRALFTDSSTRCSRLARPTQRLRLSFDSRLLSSAASFRGKPSISLDDEADGNGSAAHRNGAPLPP